MGAAASVAPIYFTAFEIGAVLICLTCAVYLSLCRRFDKLQSKLFFVIVLDIAIAAASDVAAEFARSYASADPNVGLYVQIAAYIYFVSHTMLAPLFFLYVRVVCRETSGLTSLRANLIGVPFYVVELIALTNPITHWMYSYDSNLALVRGWGVYLTYAVGFLYLAFGLAQLFRRWRALTPERRRALMYFFFMVVFGVIVQMLVPGMRIELFAESLALLGLMMFVENEEDFIDFEMGVYNRHALEMELSMLEKSTRSYPVIALRVTNVESYAHVGGSTLSPHHISVEIAEYLKTVMPWYCIYRTSASRFVMLNSRKSFEEMRECADTIARRFDQGWKFRDINLDLHVVVALARIPEDLPTASDVFYLTDTPVPPQTDSGVLTGEDLGYLMRRAEVERAVQRGFDEGTYETYYQPIFDKDGKVVSAEALMRLHDSVLGDVPPYEFIEVAERMGKVEEIGAVALRDVCMLLKTGVPQRFGVCRISVNLSVIQCMQNDFANQVVEQIEKSGVDPGLVTFEITESVAAGDYGFLERLMSGLREREHRFAMDDYGTGYSNMHALVALDFDVIKIDKSVLWDAEKNEMGMIILQNAVLMMRDIGCEVLVEGVETEEQVKILHALGVDFYQGFFYAKPMPRDEFLAFLENHAEQASAHDR